jgi:DNA-binding CsgD family transcriptional regulator
MSGPRKLERGAARLSETERRIVALVVAGHTDEEVAERLFLTPRAVEWSLAKIYRKLMVRSRAELAAEPLFDPGPTTPDEEGT